MEQKYDVIVIGTGTAGKSVAYNCKNAGLTTAIIDKREFGGTCELRGCDPKKVLVGVAEALDTIERYKEKGIFNGSVSIKWDELMNFKNDFTSSVPEHTESSLKEAGIEVIHGLARFIATNKLEVNENILEGRYIVIATGAIPQKLPYTGEEYIKDSEYFLQMKTLPKHIVFIGGGYISFEFAHIAKRAGVEVTIINRSGPVLKNFEQSLVSKLVEFSRSIGITVLMDTNITKIETNADHYMVYTDVDKSIDCDLVIHGAGRIPDISDLQLDKAGVEHTQRGIRVNKYMQSSTNLSVYAVGDVADFSLPLTPIAGKEGGIASQNIISGNSVEADFKEVPSVVFTTPPLARVGMSEEEVIEKGIAYEIHQGDSTTWYSSKRINEKASGYKVIIEKVSGKVLGAHIFGHGGEEVINIFALAIQEGIKAEALKELIYTYPTKSSDIEYYVG